MTAGGLRFRPIRTYSEAWLQRHRDTHARHAEFGTHRHPYLRDLMKEIATELTAAERPTLLDYGCGKGAFLREMSQSGLFRFARGYDPAVTAFKLRPSQLYDVVLCLDVLDQVEDEFVESIIQDVAQFTGRFAVFNIITVQTPALAHLNPRSAEVWKAIIGRHMPVDQMIVRPATEQELKEGACPERAIFVVSPRAEAQPSSAGPGVPAADQTYSPEHLGRQQKAHAVADGYGRHRHLYLHEMMRDLAANLRRAKPSGELSWLDYGCGKGGFIEEVRPLGLFTTIQGYDPAVAAFAARPEGRFDLVTCLDVLDVVEPQFLGNLLGDVAALTGGLALFDLLTRPKADGTIRPHPPFYWSHVVGQTMNVLGTKVEFPGMEGFERVIVQAAPRH
ncbi:MAG: methyltransferase domain-containing protein [Caulobacteraceae bacterium]|nr:methyltransferase domain-containing protein [Caulobacteraceae bacterium]